MHKRPGGFPPLLRLFACLLVYRDSNLHIFNIIMKYFHSVIIKICIGKQIFFLYDLLGSASSID